MDEITELPSSMQGKLLRVIEDKELYRLGSTNIVNVDLRILSASNRDVDKSVDAGDFRGDLYFRLNEYHIHVPPLRRRPKDILPLAYHFLRLHTHKNNKKIKSISASLVEHLQQYPYPGNVRELEHIISSAVLAERSETLGLASVQNLKFESSTANQLRSNAFPPLAEVQKQHIFKALELTNGNRTRAAQILGIGLRTLQRKLKNIAS